MQIRNSHEQLWPIQIKPNLSVEEIRRKTRTVFTSLRYFYWNLHSCLPIEAPPPLTVVSSKFATCQNAVDTGYTKLSLFITTESSFHLSNVFVDIIGRGQVPTRVTSI